jgi:hypothetical protein
MKITRTPEQTASFKATNISNSNGGVHVAFDTRGDGLSFTVAWQTSLGRIGWTTLEGCQSMDEAIERFQKLRARGVEVPFDADMDTIGVSDAF